MRSINIILYFNNSRYADSLSRGLCYKYTGLNIFFAEKEKDFVELMDKGVLLTDKKIEHNSKTIALCNGGMENYPYCLPKTCSIKEIFDAIRNIAHKEYGVLSAKFDSNTDVIGVFSKKGGIGLTSFAITMARMIAAETERKVLYLNLGLMDDYCLYTGISDYSAQNKLEYLFMKEEGLPVNIESYCNEDFWGVSYFKPEHTRNTFFCYGKEGEIVNYAMEENYFSYIVIDFGKRTKVDNSYLKYCFEVGKEEIICQNIDDNFTTTFSSVSDNNSFLIENENVEISMKGLYANRIHEITRTVI